MNNDGLLSHAQAAAIFGVAVGTIHNWRDKGWLRMTQDSPPRAPLQAYSEAAATARWAPWHVPDEELLGDYIEWRRNIYGSGRGPLRDGATRRGVESVLYALKAVCEPQSDVVSSIVSADV